MHEPREACVAKGKAVRKHECGSKIAVAEGSAHGVSVGPANFADSRHAGDTLPQLLENVKTYTFP